LSSAAGPIRQLRAHGEAIMNRRHFLIIPAHCTGLNTIIAVHREMPGKLVMPSTGTRVIFGA
jgi:hypothetical protein